MNGPDLPDAPCLRGVITDGDLDQAEAEFPGICRYYAAHRGEHRTFLELMVAFLGLCPAARSSARAG